MLVLRLELASVESTLCNLATLAINKEKKEISIKGGKQDHLTLPDHLLRFGNSFFSFVPFAWVLVQSILAI